MQQSCCFGNSDMCVFGSQNLFSGGVWGCVGWCGMTIAKTVQSKSYLQLHVNSSTFIWKKKVMVNRMPTRNEIQQHEISLPLRKNPGWIGVELASLPHWAVMHQSHPDQPDSPLQNRISGEANLMHKPQQCQPCWWDIKPAHKMSNCICKSVAKLKPAPVNETWWNTDPIFQFKEVILC